MTCSVEGRSLIKSSGRLLEAPPAPVPPGPDGCHGWRTVMCTVHMICQWCALCTCSMTASVPPPLRGLQVGLISRAGHQGQQRRLARYAASQVPRGACCGWARGGRAASSGGLRCAPYLRVGPGRGGAAAAFGVRPTGGWVRAGGRGGAQEERYDAVAGGSGQGRAYFFVPITPMTQITAIVA